MNMMKKFCTVLVFSGASLFGMSKFKTADEAIKLISSAHVRSFAVDNLFKQRLAEINVWYSVTDEVGKFITDNSRGSLIGSIKGMQDSAIMNSLKKLQQANVDMVNTLQLLWNGFFSKKQALSSAEYAQAKTLIAKLRTIRGVVAAEEKNVALSKLLKEKSDPRASAARVLQAWAMILTDTLDKAIKDFDLINAQYLINAKK